MLQVSVRFYSDEGRLAYVPPPVSVFSLRIPGITQIRSMTCGIHSSVEFISPTRCRSEEMIPTGPKSSEPNRDRETTRCALHCVSNNPRGLDLGFIITQEQERLRLGNLVGIGIPPWASIRFISPMTPNSVLRRWPIAIVWFLFLFLFISLGFWVFSLLGSFSPRHRIFNSPPPYVMRCDRVMIPSLHVLRSATLWHIWDWIELL